MTKEMPVCGEHNVHEDVVERIQKMMRSEDEYNRLGTLFKMFSDPTRLKILSLLFQEELCVCDISCLLDMSQSAVSHQLSVLRASRLIKYRREGKNIFYSLDDEHIQKIYDAGLSHILE
ncbi:MAG: metalloregulator ArsR/SmtB family transcription factor [Longicatena sp.]